MTLSPGRELPYSECISCLLVITNEIVKYFYWTHVPIYKWHVLQTGERKLLRKRGKISSTPPPSLPLCFQLLVTHMINIFTEHLLCARHSTKSPFRIWLSLELRSEQAIGSTPLSLKMYICYKNTYAITEKTVFFFYSRQTAVKPLSIVNLWQFIYTVQKTSLRWTFWPRGVNPL